MAATRCPGPHLTIQIIVAVPGFRPSGHTRPDGLPEPVVSALPGAGPA